MGPRERRKTSCLWRPSAATKRRPKKPDAPVTKIRIPPDSYAGVGDPKLTGPCSHGGHPLSPQCVFPSVSTAQDLYNHAPGRMAERFKAADLKSAVGATPP